MYHIALSPLETLHYSCVSTWLRHAHWNKHLLSVILSFATQYTWYHLIVVWKLNIYDKRQLITLGLLQAFEESADWALFSWICNDQDLHISVFKYLVASTKATNSNQPAKFIKIGSRFQATLQRYLRSWTLIQIGKISEQKSSVLKCTCEKQPITFSVPPSSMHRTAFLMYSCPWMDGAKHRASVSNTSTFRKRENFLMLRTSAAEYVGLTSLLSALTLFAIKIVL